MAERRGGACGHPAFLLSQGSMKNYETEKVRRSVANRMARTLTANIPEDALVPLVAAERRFAEARREFDAAVWDAVKLAFDNNGRSNLYR
jgi:hypothetical protein